MTRRIARALIGFAIAFVVVAYWVLTRGAWMTRDNKIWIVLMVGAILSTLSAHFDLLELCCALTDKTKALIEIGSLITATVSGVMFKSPLDISEQGRKKYLADRVKLTGDRRH